MTVSALAASLLVAGGSVPAQAAPEPAAPAVPKVTEFPRPADPDAPLRAALEEARKQNKPVEVEAAYTEGSRTWAYPDGHLTTQSYAGPAQLKQADGSWDWIDTTLVEQDGVLKPKLAKAKIEFSAGGADRPFASMERGDGQKVSFGWPTELPKPTVKGNVATFVDAAGQGADLVVTALPTGFRHDVVLREQPKGPVEFRIPVETDGLDFAKNRRGGLELTDSKGRQVASAAEPVTIDAGPSAAETRTAGAVPPRTGKIDTRVVEEKGEQTLVLTPDLAFLADPATRYPVTVDPTTTLTLQSDLVVSNTGNADTSPASQRLVTSIERTNSSGALTYSHSLLKFDTGVLAGRSVGSARLDMYADQLVGCRWYGPGGIEAKRVTSAWPQYVSWSNQPSVTSFGSSVQLCPSTSSIDDLGNWIPRTFTWSVTAMAQAWAAGQPNEGIRLSGTGTTDPTQNSGWSVYFHSAEKVGGTKPKLTVSYFLPPEIPTVTAESIDSMDGNDAIARSTSVKVGFKSSVPEGTNLDYTVTVNDSTMVPPPSFPTGHVAHWKFDEPAGAASAADAGTGGHTATYTGSRRAATTGKLGGAIQLNDMTGSNGCCVPNSYAATSRSVLNQNSSFSISTWVRLKDSEAVQYVASQDGDPSGLSIYYLGGSHQKWRLQVSGTGGTTGYGVWVDSAKLAAVDTWSHLVAMYDSSASKIRLYVNGVLSGEADYQPSGTVAAGPFRIGGHKSGLNLLQGAVDDMRLYQRALSLADIKKLYGEVAATSYNAKPSGQVIEQTFALHNPASLKFVVRACRSGVTQPSCNESPAYRITSDAPMLPTDTETGMADPTRPILSGMVNRPSGGPVTAKYFLYDSTGAPVGSSPLGERTVNGGERASFQVPENTVQLGRTYTWQMQACALEICTAKTAAMSFTTPGTPAEPPVEDAKRLTLGKDNFVIKTAKTDPTACDGAPCPLTDTDRIQVGGAGADKLATVIGIRLEEVPDGATFTEDVLKLGTPSCPGGVCSPETVVTAAPLKSDVTGDTKASDLPGDVDTAALSFDFPIAAPQADLAHSAYSWYLLTSNREELVSFSDPGAAEQLSTTITYFLPKPPSKVLNLVAQAGDSGVVASWGLPVDNGGMVLLDGFDVEVLDGEGQPVKGFDSIDPTIAIGGLANGITYTIQVRARTSIGTSEWESAAFTPKAAPPPPPPASSQSCGFGLPAPAQTRSSGRAESVLSSSVQEYAERIKDYYRAQDAVLEGRAATVWEAPGVTPEAPSTAKLSLLNDSLVTERQLMDASDISRTNSTVTLENVVPRDAGDGMVYVTATVKRTWEHASTASPTGQKAAIGAMADTLGQIEPSEPFIDIFAFDRCGKVTIIQVPVEVEMDSTDSRDRGTGGSCEEDEIPGHTTAASAISRTAASPTCQKPTSTICSAPGRSSSSTTKPGFLGCRVEDYLGKGWYYITQMSSTWGPPTENTEHDRDQRWKIDKIHQEAGISWSGHGDNRWGPGTSFGKALLGWGPSRENPRINEPAAKLTAAGTACFYNVSDTYTAGTTVGISGGFSAAPGITGELGFGVNWERNVKEQCESVDPKKVSDKRWIDNFHRDILATCEEAGANSCSIGTYRHAFYSELEIGFDYTYKSDGKKKTRKFDWHPMTHKTRVRIMRDSNNLSDYHVVDSSPSSTRCDYPQQKF
ncbi:LamG-like jellyroll fold domain-containing protein [Streptosporangium sp. NBC_01469]|uniref:LamG-like jellyroll fold domain-containing protein n=1 Tax=Streptosporangium sp. NBC_01469 TaxID=2903898 RepID=UPI002E2A48D2|nr:LamG-like jellyroll fold domain-containing protein [Streptosporangium sp. NBC_01469]